jgi:hypothetical protein
MFQVTVKRANPIYYNTNIVLLRIVHFVRSVIFRQRNIPASLFLEALKHENNGHYESALISYQAALAEVNKSHYQADLRNKIIEKIKILHTVIQYEQSTHPRNDQ